MSREKNPSEDLVRRPTQRPGREGGKRESNRQKRLEGMFASSLDLFLQRGLEAVTVEEIAAGAGIAKGGFYRYFRDKEHFVEWMFSPLTTEVLRVFEESEGGLREARTAEALSAIYQSMAQGLTAAMLPNLGLCQLYLQEYRAPGIGARKPVVALADVFTKKALALTEAAHTHGLLRRLTPSLSAAIVIGAVERLIYGLLNGEDLGPLDAIPQTLISVMLDGLRAHPPAS